MIMKRWDETTSKIRELLDEIIYDPLFDIAGKIFFKEKEFYLLAKYVNSGNETITGMIIYPNYECQIYKMDAIDNVMASIAWTRDYCHETAYIPPDNYTGIDIRSVDQRFVMILNQAFHAINARFKLVDQAPSLKSATIFVHVKDNPPSMKILEQYFEQLPPEHQTMEVQKKLYTDTGFKHADAGVASFPDFANDMENGTIFVDNINPDDSRSIHHAIYVTDRDIDMPGIIDATLRVMSYCVTEPFPFDGKKSYDNAIKQITIDIIPYLIEHEVLEKEWIDVASRLKREMKHRSK